MANTFWKPVQRFSYMSFLIIYKNTFHSLFGISISKKTTTIIYGYSNKVFRLKFPHKIEITFWWRHQRILYIGNATNFHNLERFYTEAWYVRIKPSTCISLYYTITLHQTKYFLIKQYICGYKYICFALYCVFYWQADHILKCNAIKIPNDSFNNMLHSENILKDNFLS